MASLPLFFDDAELKSGGELWLNEETARHVVQVLRMQPGEGLQLTNGRGQAARAVIKEAGKKKCSVTIESVERVERRAKGLHLAIGFTKNASRNEWLLEKITEMGVERITPLATKRTERERIRYDRWKGILQSAMMQSQQYWLPELHELTGLEEVIKKYGTATQKLVAHCIEEKARLPIKEALLPGRDTLVIIGPEGDLTDEEVDMCVGHNFTGITMGVNRLRTETAGLVACSYFNMVNNG